MSKPIEKLAVIDGETLQDMRFQPGKFHAPVAGYLYAWRCTEER